MPNYYKIMISTIVLLFISTNIFSQGVSRPDAHAPIGVMGDHMHHKGEFMFAYRYKIMSMKGNQIGTKEINETEIVTTIPNRFAGLPMQPPTLRVVPLKMTMNMHMFSMMYAPSDRITLMGMVMISSKSMDHITYQGATGTNALGKFTAEASGFGDTKFTLMYKVSKHIHANLGLSIPTGSIDKEDQALTPMNMEPSLRLPYPMQIGSGTWDLLPALTFFKTKEKVGFGTQASAVIRLGDNEYSYSFGNEFNGTIWGSYLINKWLSSSIRFTYSKRGKVSGIDSEIVAPVQTANPDFQGSSQINGHIGLNAIGQNGFIKNQRLSIEFGIPLYQKFNGPQLKSQSVLTIGWQYAI